MRVSTADSSARLDSAVLAELNLSNSQVGELENIPAERLVEASS
jgi:hypothetical protein